MLNKFRNKGLYKDFSNNVSFNDSNGDLIENKLVMAKDSNVYVITHIQYSNDDGTLSHRGRYIILNNQNNEIGELKHVFNESETPKYMNLSDINIIRKYRNIGLGSMTLELFEDRAKSYGAKYIAGELSSVDEETLEDKEHRNNFYLRRGYEILDSKKIFKTL